MFYVYVIYSEKFNKIYIGFTSDLEKRVTAHNHPKHKAWTRKFQPWVLAYKEVFETKIEAMAREKKLKGAKGREFIWDIINSKNQ